MSDASTNPPSVEYLRKVLQEMLDTVTVTVPPPSIETPKMDNVAPEIFIKEESYPLGSTGEDGPIRQSRPTFLPLQIGNGEPFLGFPGGAGTSPQTQAQAMDVGVGQVESGGQGLPVSNSGPGGSASEFWQGKMAYLLNNDVGTRKDVTFIVGPEKEEIPTHKLFLALASPQFDYLLYDSPLVRNSTKPLIVVLEDVSSNAFRMMLKFIYINHVDVPMEDAMELLKVSYRFALPDLVERCRSVIRAGINDGNAAEIFEKVVTSFRNERSLREYALAHILLHAKRVLQTPGFLKLSRESLCTILERDELIINELYVFQAAIRWAEQSIRKREQNADLLNLKISDRDIRYELGEALFLIRFPLMKAQQFKVNVCSRYILTDKEKLDICLTFIPKREDNENQSELLPFSQVKRGHGTTLDETPSSTESELAATDTDAYEPPKKRLKTELEVVNMAEPIASSSERNSPPIPWDMPQADEPQPSTSGQLDPITIEVEGVQSTLERVSPQSPAGTEPELLDFDAISCTFSEYLNTINCHSSRICAEFIVSDYIKGLGLDSIVRRDFPDLKQYHLKLTFVQLKPSKQSEKRFHRFVTCTININSYLCFTISNSRVALQNLWNTNVNLSIEIHGCVVIKMDHELQELVLNCSKNAIEILEGLKNVPLKSIALGCCKFTRGLDLNFQYVEKLILYGVKGSINFNDILPQCPSLVKLSLWKSTKYLRVLEPVNLSLIGNPSKLKCLAIDRSNISALRSPIKCFPNLDTLHIHSSIHSSGFLHDFPKMFPNIKKLSIDRLSYGSENSISLKVVVSILNIESLRWVRVDLMNWNHEDSTEQIRAEFRQLTGFNDTTKKNASFVFVKSDYTGNVWEVAELLDDEEDGTVIVPGGYYEKKDQNHHSFFNLEGFYKPFSKTAPAWHTYASFGFGFGD